MKKFQYFDMYSTLNFSRKWKSGDRSSETSLGCSLKQGVNEWCFVFKAHFLSFLQVFEMLWAFYLERIALPVDCLWELLSQYVYIYSKTEDRTEGLCQTTKRSVKFLPGVLEAHLTSMSSIEFELNRSLAILGCWNICVYQQVCGSKQELSVLLGTCTGIGTK